MGRKRVRIVHRPTGTLIADGPLGWGITPFEGNYYIGRRHLRTDGFRASYLPGICIYKFLYVWMSFVAPDGTKSPLLGWMYFLPNPLFPFIWFRIGVPGRHPEIEVERYEAPESVLESDSMGASERPSLSS